MAVREGRGRKGTKKEGRAWMLIEAPYVPAGCVTCIVSCHLHNNIILQVRKLRFRKRTGEVGYEIRCLCDAKIIFLYATLTTSL